MNIFRISLNVRSPNILSNTTGDDRYGSCSYMQLVNLMDNAWILDRGACGTRDLNPGSPAWEADVLDQTRPVPQGQTCAPFVSRPDKVMHPLPLVYTG